MEVSDGKNPGLYPLGDAFSFTAKVVVGINRAIRNNCTISAPLLGYRLSRSFFRSQCSVTQFSIFIQFPASRRSKFIVRGSAILGG